MRPEFRRSFHFYQGGICMEQTYALITGASSGIGREIAEIFAEHHHNLILVARREDRLLSLKQKLEADYSVSVQVIPEDLSVVDAAKDLHEKTKSMKVDNLVNSAGFGDWGGFLDSSWQRQQDMVQVNITALMQLTYLYGNDMRRNGGGHILNLSSVASFSGGPYMSIYYASKGYVLSFSQAVAEELKGTGVTVTALCPGPTSTGFESAAQMKNSRMFTVLHPAEARDVAQRGYDAMQAGKVVAYHSAATKLMNIGSRLCPRKTARKFAMYINGRPADEKKVKTQPAESAE